MRLDDRITFPETPYDVVTMGELLIDMISTDYVPTLKEAVHFQKSFGGSPGNIAVNLAKMKHRSALITSIGQDDFGRFLLDFLREQNVETKGIQITSGHTSMVFVTKSTENPIFLPLRHADLALKLTDEQFQLITDAKIFHFTAWALSYPSIRRVTMELLQHAHRHQKLITFDPNYREVLWEPGHDGPGFIRRNILPLVDIIKPSEIDAEHLLGRQSLDAYAEQFKDTGNLLVIMTLGADGLMVIDDHEVFRIPSHARKVVDTTGAGDAFWAGFMAGLLTNSPVRQALFQGSYSAAYKLGTMGAICELPDAQTLEAWINQEGEENRDADRIF
jgi:sugar/nucleoside kinase (ribokinase family)